MEKPTSTRTTLSKAIEFSNECKFICLAIPPFQIVYANNSLKSLLEWNQQCIEGENLSATIGPLTESSIIEQTIQETLTNGASSCDLNLYKKSSMPIRGHLECNLINSLDYFGWLRPSHILIVVSDILMEKTSPQYKMMSSLSFTRLKAGQTELDGTTTGEDFSDNELMLEGIVT